MPVRLPSPSKYGLPPRFASWRPEQERGLTQIIDADERFVTACMPTGSGKSLVPVALSRMLEQRVLILTATKGLQDQYLRDFTGYLADIRGKANYACKAMMPGGVMAVADGGGDRDTFVPVEGAPCHFGVECDLKTNFCSYYGEAVPRAKSAQIVLMNYAKWLSTTDGKEFGEFDMIVLDEAHSASDLLASHLSVEVEWSDFENLLRTRRPANLHMSMKEWAGWARNWLPAATTRLAELKTQIKQSGGRAKKDQVRELRELTAMEKKLSAVAGMQGEWVVDELTRTNRQGAAYTVGVKFDPVWPAPYAEQYLFRRIPKVLLVSATIRPKSLELLGVKKEDSMFFEYPSSFPVVRRPVTHVPTVRMSFKITTEEEQVWVDRIDEIIGARLDRKGILHTVSYKRRNTLMQRSRYAHLFISHDSRTTRDKVLEFKEADAPAILISPSVSTGFDFPYDEAEYCVITKVPFPDTRSAVLKARILKDKQYGNYLAAQDLVQMAGRGMRAVDDRFETFVVDDHVNWFIWSSKQLFPKWFLDAYRKVDRVPKPLAKL